MITLDSVGKKYATDKSSEIHNYLIKYEKYLPFNRYSNISILEIGVYNGSSLKLWKEYFSQSKILGIDIEPNCLQYKEDRINIEIGSQYDGEFLKKIGEKYDSFDLIIDDGSHLCPHIIFSFENLFHKLNSGGVYVVEDVITSYLPHCGGGYRERNSTVEYFKDLCDHVNFKGTINYNYPNLFARREDWTIESVKSNNTNTRTDIESIIFLNGIIMITKR